MDDFFGHVSDAMDFACLASRAPATLSWAALVGTLGSRYELVDDILQTKTYGLWTLWM